MPGEQKTNEVLKNIRNKQRRQKVFAAIQAEKAKERHLARATRAKEERENPQLKEERLAANIPETIESKRVFDETIAAEVEGEDEFAEIFSKSEREPKVLITTNSGAKKAAYEFADILTEFIPNVTFIKRKREYLMKEMAAYCSNREFSDLIVINEDKKKVNGLTFIHLPEGPTFYFSVSSLTTTERIKGHGRATSHIPELILNNFNTRLGKTVGRLFQAIFPPRPEIQGRQVITLHNQRDYVFFRRHRYVFRNEEKVGLQELGPQFTLKLRRLQKGIKNETEWEHRPDMERDKKKFYL
ncbi:Brix-domain-containing protein [Metschnikowia bicuspidata var. bicuspidata NRRL YB-4993]|uniref:Brix-domain-containing protein n=1 Tax=Metschnikowia bicuspidata var. bicuspidata NRRL YB-4993 TaxID=869754 RepID=A0A1A0HKG8_9ASCO|nr:Brix-domain-containing protein [Metschnikowia bicuspidata var. bicuspidata NRRL YB-4993]OBA24520.1 Brix-domain-containing protein [Metschnikowia bicuspidata var. bicuspidata NRRL YB-4993]